MNAVDRGKLWSYAWTTQKQTDIKTVTNNSTTVGVAYLLVLCLL